MATTFIESTTALSTAWKALAEHFESVRHTHLRELFAKDPERGKRMTVEAVGLFLDYSKNRVTDETLRLLIGLADEAGLHEHIHAPWRQDQRDGKPGGTAYCPTHSEGHFHHGGRRRRCA